MGHGSYRRAAVLFLLMCACLPVLGGAVRAQAVDAPSGQAREEAILEQSGMLDMLDSLDKGTRQLLTQAGADTLLAGGAKVDGDKLFRALCRLAQEKLVGPIQSLAVLVAVLLLSRLAACFPGAGMGKAVALCGSVCCALVVVAPLLGLIESCGRAAASASAFLLAAVPAYSALLAVSGGVAAGGGYTFLTLGAGSAIPLLVSGVVVPLLRMFLALGLSSAVSGVKLQKLITSLYGMAKWLLVLSVTLFSGVLAVQTILNTQLDAAASKTAKLIASSAIPIVGGALGDAVGAIQSSVQVVKGGAGAFGMLAALCVFAPAIWEAALWVGVCAAGRVAGDICGAQEASALLEGCVSAAKLVLAVLVSLLAVCASCAGVVLFVKGE